MKFAFNKQCVLEHVNTRKGKNEGSVPQFDLKFSCDSLPVEAAAVLESLDGLRVIKLHKVKLTPGQSGGAFGATFTLTVEDPDAETLHSIMQMQHESVQVNLEQDRKDLADQADEKADKTGKVKKTDGAEQAAVH